MLGSLVAAFAAPSMSGAGQMEVDLLIVGGNESGCAAAVQAARLGVRRVALVNDIAWLGGQFSAEGLGCVDEKTRALGKNVNFPRSGSFLEIIERIRAHNRQAYGVAAPGNAWSGTETIRPAVAARIFEEWLAPYDEKGSGQIQVLRPWQPERVVLEGNRIAGVIFERPDEPGERLTVNARLTLDASDWGDVIRLSGARYAAGPDLRSRFGEPSAPEAFDADAPQEMNPLTWSLVLREAGRDATVSRPATYDPRCFADLDSATPWHDCDMAEGIYSQSGLSLYTQRRLVDRWHFGLPEGSETVLLNGTAQDYPLCQLPRRVTAALEATEFGASRKNIVDLTPAQRRIIFEDAKRHSLGALFHLQTKVHDRVGDFPQSFRYLELVEEFGTPDRLPPKPYVREGLRLEALYMLREQDIRSTHREPLWARVMPPDAVFGFHFFIDFHPTRRSYEAGDRSGPWRCLHTASRNWHTETDRAVFPLRGLVPVERDGLLGASKNIGVSSIVQAALRLHGQMMLVGQASATLAWMSLRENLPPRSVAACPRLVRDIQCRLVRGAGGPGVLLWPWHDLAPDDPHFEAANLLAVRGIWVADADSLFFQPGKTVTRRELACALARLCRALPDAKDWPVRAQPMFVDVAAGDPDRPFIEAMMAWGRFERRPAAFEPDRETDWKTLHEWLVGLGLPASRGQASKAAASLSLTRAECVQHLWRVVRLRGEWFPDPLRYLCAAHDADGDGHPDLDDALPFDCDNDNSPDRLQPLGQ